jgi:hypothetical protein
MRGVSRSSRFVVRAAMDAKAREMMMRVEADGKGVWSCPPDAGVKPIEMRFRPCGRNAEIGDGG